MDKLIIQKAGTDAISEVMIRVSKKANLLLEEIAKQSGQSKAFVASRMIEYAFDRTIVTEKETEE